MGVCEREMNSVCGSEREWGKRKGVCMCVCVCLIKRNDEVNGMRILCEIV